MKERDTVILPVRIKKNLMAEVDLKVSKKGISRNSWLIWAIGQGLRSHKKQGTPERGESSEIEHEPTH